MSIGDRIKEQRKLKKLTQAELAEQANLSRSYLADIERNRYNPSVETLKSIANGLHINLSLLIEEQAYDANTLPEWATYKDKRDFKKMLEDDGELMFDGIPLNGEDKRKIKDVLTGLFWEAKHMNKEARRIGQEQKQNNKD
ncbi:helix-turn-helix domain-containing protein [Paenibacillus sp. FA6]|uniref:helix-turn-helix domain-containing protein n=1 Tax=Paenibacillus sp. FA6 TaxID=3413029 RepID=UPI003F655399